MPGSVTCTAHHRAISDTMDLLSGKWKIRIIGELIFGKRRFGELLGGIHGIAAKMLSKELQDLETNKMIRRTVLQTKPITVEYELTPYGRTVTPIINAMADWGHQHRELIVKNHEKEDQPA
ncbi:helix-turn-helix transcriptional regulator [Dyadobacter sandarakinus]|uniref:Helix-turn-helix transcriptional regulator n=2 Tax=Dyadobacter sandarakinus TaxID=2747268 RepID=A0ABX7ID13_9BACT|nr:helix-turn-helix transcriptional regulator [Dyadobacter sandarakinus]